MNKTLQFDLMSDLHEDAGRFDIPAPNEGSTVLVLAGDLAEYQNLRSNNFKTLRAAKDLYEHVIYVPGNHEYYGGNYQNVNSFLEEECAKIDVKFLRGDVFELGDVVFVGCTLFTNFNDENELTMKAIKQYMADFTYITYTEPDGHRHIITPENMLTEHKLSVKYIKQQAERFRDKKIVLVTHHAMSRNSVSPRLYAEYHINGGYYSDLDYLFHDNKNIHVHCHGHMHNYFRYDVANTRVYCNPRGYVKRGETSPNYGPCPIEV